MNSGVIGIASSEDVDANIDVGFVYLKEGDTYLFIYLCIYVFMLKGPIYVGVQTSYKAKFQFSELMIC